MPAIGQRAPGLKIFHCKSFIVIYQTAKIVQVFYQKQKAITARKTMYHTSDQRKPEYIIYTPPLYHGTTM